MVSFKTLIMKLRYDHALSTIRSACRVIKFMQKKPRKMRNKHVNSRLNASRCGASCFLHAHPQQDKPNPSPGCRIEMTAHGGHMATL